MCGLPCGNVHGLLNHVQSNHGQCYVSLCNPETTVVSYKQFNQLFTKCLSCKICPPKGAKGSSCIFQSMAIFEEHCNKSHPWDTTSSNTEDIKCRLPGCTYISHGEVQFYQHLATNHRTVVIVCDSSGVPHLSYHVGGKGFNMGQRCSCLLCKRVFFTPGALREHITSHMRHNKKGSAKGKEELVHLLFKESTLQRLPDHVVNALKGNPLVMNKHYLQTRRPQIQYPERMIAQNLDQVLISSRRYSRGKKILTFNGSHRNNGTLDMWSSCVECENQLMVHMPPGICVLKRQPVVTLRRDALQNYMRSYAMVSNRPLPNWYRMWYRKNPQMVNMIPKKTVFCFNVSNQRVKQRQRKSAATVQKRKVQKVRARTATVRWTTNMYSPIWEKYCRNCYKLYDEVFVLREECIHKRFIIVSLVNVENSASSDNCRDNESSGAANEKLSNDSVNSCIKHENCDDIVDLISEDEDCSANAVTVNGTTV